MLAHSYWVVASRIKSALAGKTLHTWHEEVEERPELQDIVLDRRPAEHQPMLRLHPLNRLRISSQQIRHSAEGPSSELLRCVY